MLNSRAGRQEHHRLVSVLQVHVTGKRHIEITGTVPLASYLHLFEFGTGI